MTSMRRWRAVASGLLLDTDANATDDQIDLAAQTLAAAERDAVEETYREILQWFAGREWPDDGDEYRRGQYRAYQADALLVRRLREAKLRELREENGPGVPFGGAPCDLCSRPVAQTATRAGLDPAVVALLCFGAEDDSCRAVAAVTQGRPLPDRAAWLLHGASSAGRVRIDVEQYDELRAEACAMRETLQAIAAVALTDDEPIAQRMQAIAKAVLGGRR